MWLIYLRIEYPIASDNRALKRIPVFPLAPQTKTFLPAFNRDPLKKSMCLRGICR
jgi:hypothetical protein